MRPLLTPLFPSSVNLAAVSDLDAIAVLLMILTIGSVVLFGLVIPPWPVLVVPFPARSLLFDSQFPPTECAARLSALTGNRIRGRVAAHGFILHIRVDGIDSFRSFAAGAIEPRGGGSRVRVRIGLHGALFLFGWLIFFIGGSALFAKLLSLDGLTPIPPERYLPALALSLIGAIAVSWIFSRLWPLADMDELDGLVRRVLEAT